MLVCISSYRITQLYALSLSLKADKMTDHIDDILDYRGLKCPLPVLKARRALKSLSAGDQIVIWADDPAAPLDMAHFCAVEGHVLAEDDDTSHFIFQITKGSSA